MNKIIPLLLALVLASSCSSEQPVSFEETAYSHENFSLCQSNNCPTIKVHFLQAAGDDKKSNLINQKINQALIDKIAATEDDTHIFSDVEKAIEFFIQDFITFEEDFGNAFVSYDIDIFMQVSYQSDDFISIELNYYLFTGGAHGYGGTTFLNFDAKTGKELTDADLFNNNEALLTYCENRFREVYQITAERSINSSGFWFEGERFHLPENIGFTEIEMILHYNQYEIASYAEGPIILTIPLLEIEEFLEFY